MQAEATKTRLRRSGVGNRRRRTLPRTGATGAKPKALKKIVVPTDFSPSSTTALIYALALGNSYGAKVSAVHAIDPLDYQFGPRDVRELQHEQVWTAARENMAAWLKAGEFTRVEGVLRAGDPATVISNLMVKEPVDLIVLGTAGRKHAARALFGSVAEEVFRNARCPVVVLGPNVVVRPGKVQMKKLLFATNLEAHSLATLPALLQLASSLGAEVVALRAIHPDIRSAAEQYRIRKEAEEKLQAAAGPELGKHIKEIRVVFENVIDAICERAATADFDAIVMGVRSGSPWDRAATHIPWAIAHRVIAEAKCPVITLRG